MSSLSAKLNTAVGSSEIAVNISGFLFGCATIQAHVYYQTYPNDPRRLKLFVAVIWLLELGLHITASHVSYTLSVLDWGNPLAVLSEPRTVAASFFIGSVVTPLVESFYLRRILKLSEQRIPVYLGLLVVWLRYLGWVILAVHEYQLGLISGEFVARWSWLLITLLSLGVTVDAIISIIIAYLLYQQRDSAFLRTTQLINRLIFWTFQTGLVTSIAYLIVLICFITMKHDLVWMGMLACVTKVFSNCLLASLNARTAMLSAHQSLPLHFASRDRGQDAGQEIPAILITVEHRETTSVDTIMNSVEKVC